MFAARVLYKVVGMFIAKSLKKTLMLIIILKKMRVTILTVALSVEGVNIATKLVVEIEMDQQLTPAAKLV